MDTKSFVQKYCLQNTAPAFIGGGCSAALQLVSPKDVVMDHVLPFLMLPAYRFDGEDEKLGDMF